MSLIDNNNTLLKEQLGKGSGTMSSGVAIGYAESDTNAG